jgi:hypothetical protein
MVYAPTISRFADVLKTMGPLSCPVVERIKDLIKQAYCRRQIMRTSFQILLFSTTILLAPQVQAQELKLPLDLDRVSPAPVADAGRPNSPGPAILAQATMGPEGMGHRGMMDRGEMGPDTMGRGDMPCGMMDRGSMMGDHGPSRGFAGPPMRLMMALIDTDGDGALSLEEIQTAHARVFRYADADKDGKLTPEEIRSFMHGDRGGRSDKADK